MRVLMCGVDCADGLQQSQGEGVSRCIGVALIMLGDKGEERQGCARLAAAIASQLAEAGDVAGPVPAAAPT